MKVFFISFGVVFGIVLVLILVYRLRVKAGGQSKQKNVGIKKTIKSVEVIKKDQLSLEDAIVFFQQPSIRKQLKESDDLIPVVFKEVKENTDWISVVFCIYSKRQSSIKNLLMYIETTELDADLLSLFGDKDMLVLK